MFCFLVNNMFDGAKVQKIKYNNKKKEEKFKENNEC